jgi:uncharacterized repeat protein (TIGR01451 family)
MAFALVLAGAGALPAQTAQAASITVNGNGDTVAVDGICTLREAILNANANNQSGSTDCVAGAGADTISFNLGVSTTITLSGSQLPAITGPLAIDGGSPVSLTLNANNASGVFVISPGAQVTLTGMTVENGNAANGAIQNGGALHLNNTAVFNNVSQVGGGIYNIGMLRVMNSSIISNTGVNGGGGIYNFSGSVELVNSSVLSNTTTSASLDGGGGIFSRGSSVSTASVSITGSTIASNTAALRGGGIFNDIASELVIRNSTISGNSAVEGGGVYNSGMMAGMDVGYATIANNTASAGTGGVQLQAGSTSSLIGSIIAGNTGTTASDCSGADINSLGYNLIGSTTGCSITGTTGTNVTDVAALLGPLENNGGTTLTHLPQAGSPALDVIPFGLPVCNLAVTDQRGVVRPQGPGCDIGAVEAEFPGAALVVSKTVSPSLAIPNQVFTFTIVVRNTGGATASNVLISDTLPVSTSVAGAITFQPLGSNATDALVFGTDIAAGGSVTINIPVRLDAGVPAGTMLTNTVSVTSPSITGTVSASVSVPVAWQLFFPMIFKDAVFTSTVTTTVQ